MKLQRLRLKNFRSYKAQEFLFDDLNVVVAPNGAGKTNVLEAIYLLSTGKSARAGEISEMINFDQKNDAEMIASVEGIVATVGEEYQELSVVLTHGTYMGKRTPKRRFLVDGVARTKATFVGKLVAILFRPEDMRLIEGSPSRRRGYFDEVLGLAHPEYARVLSVYEASLRRRNRVLDAIRENRSSRAQLSYWDQSIIKNGEILNQYRRDLTEYLSRMKTSFGEYSVQYLPSNISPARLAEHAEAEVALGYTLVGPHKDDFLIKGEQDLMKYGSRGEQRLGVLFLKLGQLAYTEEKLGITPILLLDDIFSELDQVHRSEVIKMTAGRQSIITSAEEEIVELVQGAKIIRIKEEHE